MNLNSKIFNDMQRLRQFLVNNRGKFRNKILKSFLLNSVFVGVFIKPPLATVRAASRNGHVCLTVCRQIAKT